MPAKLNEFGWIGPARYLEALDFPLGGEDESGRRRREDDLAGIGFAEHWILERMKNAHTIEERRSFGVGPRK